MATVRSIVSQALMEIGRLGQNETPTAADAQLALLRFENQIDAWAADQLTLSVQSRTTISWPSTTSTQTIGPSGDINTQRPVWINTLNYVIPSSSPEVEVTLGPMDRDSYAAQTIKALPSALPLQYFYQTSIDTVLGSIFLWPQPSQSLTLYLYAPQAVGVPTSLDDILLGPPGYQEAFIYQLAIRLMTPFSVSPDSAPLLPSLAADAYARMKRPNNQPGLLGVDAALTPFPGAGYNVYSDTTSSYGAGKGFA